MFALANPPAHPAYQPQSSPLAPRSVNITPARQPHQPFFSKMPNTPDQLPQTPSHETQQIYPSPITPSTFTPTGLLPDLLPDFAQTPQHSNRRRADPRRTLTQSAEQKRSQRRDSFLKKVQDQRDDRRWDARGDQILHDDYFNQRKAWEDSLNSSAPTYEPEESSAESAFRTADDNDRWQAGWQSHTTGQTLSTITEMGERQPEEEIEDLLDAEARELEALVAMHEAPQQNEEMQEGRGEVGRPALVHQQSSPFLGPDDADFEDLLMEDDVMDMS